MKRLQIIMTLLMVFEFTIIQAQNSERPQKGHHEISIEMNDAIPVTFIYTIAEIGKDIIYIFGDQHQIKSSDSNSPFLSLNYNYFVSEKLGIGLNVGYFGRTVKRTYENRYTGELTYSKDKVSMVSITPNIKFIYFQKNRFQFYGRVLAGIALTTDKADVRNSSESISKKDTDSWFLFQFMPLGFSYGGDFAIFGELGFGVKGIFGLGLRYQF